MELKVGYHVLRAMGKKCLGRSRREFLKASALVVGPALVSTRPSAAFYGGLKTQSEARPVTNESGAPDYTLHIRTSPIEIARKRIISLTNYNGQFPGPLLRFKEGQKVVVDIYNDTDVPEQLHWHGLKVPTEVDGASEEGTPYIPARGKRRIVFIPGPAGLRFYHTHNRAGANLSAGQYSGQVGPVYIEPKVEPGKYDREVFVVLKEFEPTFSRGGDMPMDVLAPAGIIKALEEAGESAMRASLAKGMPKGYEVGYGLFTINGRMLGHGEPIRVKPGERVLFHILSGSATEIRSLALPGHSFKVVALDGNPVPNPATVPLLWLGTGERISAVCEMNHPGVWIMGDLDNDDRRQGMGIVVEYAHRSGKPEWVAPRPYRWNYRLFAKSGATSSEPDETFDMTFAKDNAAEEGFNRWTINGLAYPMSGESIAANFRVQHGKRYRIRMRNASDDIHPVHLHRHVFEISSVGGKRTGGVMKDVLMLAGYQEAEIDFIADNPGLSLFHCHQQLHMDYGFMTLFDYI
jgi:FtsP/CotA-like multicopper oxidase with cupredoxin domain